MVQFDINKEFNLDQIQDAYQILEHQIFSKKSQNGDLDRDFILQQYDLIHKHGIYVWLSLVSNEPEIRWKSYCLLTTFLEQMEEFQKLEYLKNSLQKVKETLVFYFSNLMAN